MLPYHGSPTFSSDSFTTIKVNNPCIIIVKNIFTYKLPLSYLHFSQLMYVILSIYVINFDYQS